MSGHSWEYKTVDSTIADLELNALGEQGWEIAGADGGRLFLKRERLSFRDRATIDQKHEVYRSFGREIPDDGGDR